MNNATKPRYAIDLDEIEREMNYAPTTARPRVPSAAPAPSGRNDPMQELAKIVGQDDPFASLLSSDPPAPPRREPSFEAPPQARPTFPPAAPHRPDDDAHAAPAADAYDAGAFDGYETEAYERGYDQDDAPYGEDGEDLRPVKRTSSRKGLIAVASVLGAAVLGVTGAMTLGGKGSPIGAGEAPLVKASTEPTKVAPLSPGGVEIPNQNKQILERAAPDRNTRVVNREEQPLDLRQATRVVPATPDSTATVRPSSASAAFPGLGEPRRVRTVAIRPDGTVVTPDAPAPAAPPPVAVASIAAPTIPAPATPSRPAAATPLPAASRPAAATPAGPTAGASPAPAASVPSAPAAPPRVAAIAPAAPAESETRQSVPSGGYVVQIGVRNSESEARDSFRLLQRKYSDLSGQPMLIRKAEVNGNTIYRVRVGPLPKDDASELCAKLQGAGGQCFVARN